MINVFFLAIFHFLAPQNPGPAAQATVFTLRVEQKKKNVEIVNHEVRLKKKFFDFVFDFNQPGGVACVASLDSMIFIQAKMGLPANQIAGLEALNSTGGMAEPLLNRAQEIVVKKGAYNFWYYQHRTDNRFNRTVRKTDIITCYRTVGKIQLLDTQETLDIVDADRPIYLVFAQTDGSQVDYLKINWK